MGGVVIVGAGMAGAEAAVALRQRGYDGAITLIGEEAHLPYQRPPLSKAFLKGEDPVAGLLIRPRQGYVGKEIDVRPGLRVLRIDRGRRCVELSNGTWLTYGHLVLATGARNRRLPGFGDRVVDLRTADDAMRIRSRIRAGGRVGIIGGGFIGLEIAAAARGLGAEVTVIEAQPRLMSRAASAVLSDFMLAEHVKNGVRIILERQVTDADDTGVTLSDDSRVAADVLIAGVGVRPNDELAQAAGLDTADGVLVNDQLLSSDPHISAIGDCARFPGASGGLIRLESVQNGVDQARHVAACLVGSTAPYTSVPWFWTEQYGRRIQIAGATLTEDEVVRRGDVGSDRFSVCRFANGRLVAVESVDHVPDHIAARKLLAVSAPAVTPEHLSDSALELKDLARTLTAAAGPTA